MSNVQSNWSIESGTARRGQAADYINYIADPVLGLHKLYSGGPGG